MQQPTTAQRTAILITMTVTVGTYVLTVTLANVALPEIQGAFAATQDQITWVVTSNLLATAVATPLSGWLDARFGRRRVLLGCAMAFAFATALCGLAASLEQLVVFRAFQGFSGAPLLPLGQAIILEIYPKEQHGRVVLLWSIGVTAGTIIAPIAGAFVTDEYSWRWVFLMVVPLAVACVGMIWVFVRPAVVTIGKRALDWIGFFFLAIAISAFQLMLDRGERLDWFDSSEIVLEAAIAIIAIYLFVAHVLTTDRPFLDLRLLRDRNYSVGLLLGIVFGMLYFTTLVLQPTMLQDLRGYPTTEIGLLQAVRGVGLLGGTFFMLLFLQRVDPRLNLFAGFLAQAVAGFAMAGFNINMTTWAVAWTTMLQGFGLGLMWSPITVVTFATLEPRHLPEGASVFHLLRNIGSSIHIALSATIVIRTARINYAELVELLNPFNEAMQFGTVMGGWDTASRAGLAALSGEVARQSAMIGYLNAYYAYGLMAVAVAPLVFLARRPRPAK